jgi:hypothetical protein
MRKTELTIAMGSALGLLIAILAGAGDHRSGADAADAAAAAHAPAGYVLEAPDFELQNGNCLAVTVSTGSYGVPSAAHSCEDGDSPARS